MQGKFKRNFFLGILTVICAAAFCACGTNAVEEDAPVMEIDGQSVVKEEYQMLVREHVSEVTRQYSTDEANREDFWTEKFSQGEPLKELMRLTKEELVYQKTIVGLAQELGITEAVDYLTLKEQQENPKASGYGLSSGEMKDYYSYVYTGLRAQVTEELKRRYEFSEEELRKLYEENISSYTSDVSVRMLVAEISSGTKEAVLQKITASMEAGADAQELKDLYPDAEIYEAKLTSLDTQAGKTGVYQSRWETAAEMHEGEVCKPLATEGKLLIMRCLKRTEHETEPFEEVKGVLESQACTARAEQEMKQRADQAEVTAVIGETELAKIAREALK